MRTALTVTVAATAFALLAAALLRRTAAHTERQLQGLKIELPLVL